MELFGRSLSWRRGDEGHQRWLVIIPLVTNVLLVKSRSEASDRTVEKPTKLIRHGTTNSVGPFGDSSAQLGGTDASVNARNPA